MWRAISPGSIEDLNFWAGTRSLYAELVQGMTNFEIAETFYNSIFNSHFGHRSIRNEYAFVFSPQGDVPPVDMGRVVNHYPIGTTLVRHSHSSSKTMPLTSPTRTLLGTSTALLRR